MARLIGENGMFVTWGGSAGPKSDDMAKTIHETLAKAFPHTVAWICHPQAYGTSWLTFAGSFSPIEPLKLTSSAIDAYIDRNVSGDLKLYDGITHMHMFNLPKDVRRKL